MLGIRDVEIINKDDLNHSKRSYKKKQILLYDTKRRIDDFVKKIKFRRNGEYEDIPHFIISKSGDIYKVLDVKYSSKTFDIDKIDRQQIKIAIENLGWLNKNTITGFFLLGSI
jgi:CBS domain containing-hemolysin-like protein